jgi:hypothetical protein
MDLNQNNLNGTGDNDGDVFQSYSINSASISDSSNSIITATNTSGNLVWSSLGTGMSIGGAISGIEDLKDIFVIMMKDIDESTIESILDNIKEKQPNNYKHCLINLVSYPNFKLMSERFMINRYEDIKNAMESTYKHINFNLTYGSLLDTMPGFKLLLKI